MHRILPWLMVLCLVVTSAQAQAPAKQVSTSPTSDELLKTLRADLQSSRADIMAKNMTLTADQAAKFWPVFSAYQKEQNVIIDAQLKGIQKFVEGQETLDDASSLALMNAHLERDAKMTTLRRKALADFQKVLPTKLAVRAMQIDRRLSLVAQMEAMAQIPLSH